MNHIILGFVAILACICFYLINDKKTLRKSFIWIVYLGALAFSSYILGVKIVSAFNNPQVWDFSAFYLWGKAAHAGYNVYSPADLHIVFNSLKLPPLDYKEFIGEIVNVGFFYPPQTILYLAPLGNFSYSTAFTIWMIFNLSFALGCIYLIHDQFFRSGKLNRLVLITTLFFLFSPVRLTVIFSQTNFILLFYLLLIWKYADKKISGIFLALAVFTKPYMIILGLFFLVKKNWGAVVYFILSAAAITGLTLLFFGKSIFLTYVSDNPGHRVPEAIFSEGINQSLHAVLLRSELITLSNPLVYMIIAISILLLTGIYLLFLMKRKLDDYVLPVLLLVGLLLYPGTLSYYGVLLLFIIFQFLNERNQLGYNSYRNIFIIGLAYFLCSFSVFSCFCFLLIVLVFKSLNQGTIAGPIKAEST